MADGVKPAKRVLVCGSRLWDRPWLVDAMLDGLYRLQPFEVITGMAKGADLHGEAWAVFSKVEVHRFPADWARNGRRAGYLRNAQMLAEGKPDLVVALTHDLAASKGTAMMVGLARDAGVPTIVVQMDPLPVGPRPSMAGAGY